MNTYTNQKIFALARMATLRPETIRANYDIAMLLESHDLLDMAMCVEGVCNFLSGLACYVTTEDHPICGIAEVHETRVSTSETVCVIVPWNEKKLPFVEC